MQNCPVCQEYNWRYVIKRDDQCVNEVTIEQFPQNQPGEQIIEVFCDRCGHMPSLHWLRYYGEILS